MIEMHRLKNVLFFSIQQLLKELKILPFHRMIQKQHYHLVLSHLKTIFQAPLENSNMYTALQVNIISLPVIMNIKIKNRRLD